MIDLEPENVSKPQPKSSRTEEEDFEKAAPQFTHPSSCWCQDVIGEYRKHEQEISVSPSTSINFSSYSNNKVESLSEEINPAFDHGDEGDVDVDPDKIYGTVTEVQEKMKGKNKEKSRRSRSRSPSPKKILRTGSLSKTASKSSSLNLINNCDIDGDDTNNAFNNTAMESEWSTFVGDNHSENVIDRQMEHASATASAPQPLFIDRDGISSCQDDSPCHEDRDHLIKSTQSSSVKSSVTIATCATTMSHEWSDESSPDHTTRLLRGKQVSFH